MAVTVGELRKRLTEIPEDAKVFVYLHKNGTLDVQAESPKIGGNGNKVILSSDLDTSAGGHGI